MVKFPRRWSKETCINYLQRRIIVASILYYEMDWSPIDDSTYEKFNRQLVSLIKDYPDIQNTEYGYCMYDYDGSTGFDLYSRLNEFDREYLTKIARNIYNLCNKEKKVTTKSDQTRTIKKKGRLF